MFAQTLESVNVSFTEFGYFQPLFQYFSAHFSPVTWMLTLDCRPAGPWDSVHFSFAVYFSLCHSDWVVSICLSSAFFCLHHSAEPISWFLYFGNCIFQFWDFLLGWAPPPPFFFFFNQDIAVVRKKVPVAYPTSSWHHPDEDVGMLGYILVKEDVLSTLGLCWHG